MAKKKDLRELKDTLDQRESEKVVEAAKSAEDDKIREAVMAEFKKKAEDEDYPRLRRENEVLMDRVLRLERELRLRRGREGDGDETEDDFPEEIIEPEVLDEPAPEQVMVHTPKPKTEAKPEAKPKPKADTKTDAPIKVSADLGVLPGVPKKPEAKPVETKPAPKPVTSKPAPPAPKPVPTPKVAPPITVAAYHHDGPGKAYKYWSYRGKCWKLTSNIWAAQQFGSDLWEPVWAWYRDGSIHHILNEQECEEYLPH